MNGPNFSPNGEKIPQGAQQVSIRPPGGPMLGGTFPVNGQSVQGLAPAPPGQAQAQLSAAPTPRGAQPVPLAMSGPAPAPARPVPARQAAQTYFQSPPAPAEMDVHSYVVKGIGPDGTPYTAPFETEFPAGTKILGVFKTG
jgi:hypothetical protein